MGVNNDKITLASTETTTDNTESTVKATEASTDNLIITDQPSRVDVTSHMPSRHSLIALLEAIPTEDVRRWPQKAYAAIKERKGRMPKDGWPSTLVFYNNKFGTHLSLQSLKNLAYSKREEGENGTNEGGPKKRKYNEGKVSSQSALIEPNKLELMRDADREFKQAIETTKAVEIANREPTRKVTRNSLRTDVLEAINKSATQYVIANPPNNMKEISNIRTYIQYTG